MGDGRWAEVRDRAKQLQRVLTRLREAEGEGEVHRRHIVWLRDLLAEGRVELYELACDHCKTQLVNHEPGVVLTSNPPQKRASCPGCGWIGSVPCGVR